MLCILLCLIGSCPPLPCLPFFAAIRCISNLSQHPQTQRKTNLRGKQRVNVDKCLTSWYLSSTFLYFTILIAQENERTSMTGGAGSTPACTNFIDKTILHVPSWLGDRKLHAPPVRTVHFAVLDASNFIPNSFGNFADSRNFHVATFVLDTGNWTYDRGCPSTKCF